MANRKGTEVKAVASIAIEPNLKKEVQKKCKKEKTTFSEKVSELLFRYISE